VAISNHFLFNAVQNAKGRKRKRTDRVQKDRDRERR
jgi:hypothetical protein